MTPPQGGQLLGTAVLELRTDNTALTGGLARARSTAESEMARMQTSMDRRLASASSSMSRTGSAMTRGVTAPILALGGAAADAALHFQQAMEMIHTQAGASQADVKALSAQVLDLARSGRVAAGPTQLADALFRLEGAGLRGKKAMDALTASAQLAAVGNANVEDTAKTLAQTWFVGIKGAGSFRDTVAELNATVGAGDLRLQQLVDALGTGILPAAKQAGLSMHDVTGALAVFGDMTNNVSGFTAQFATALHFLTNPSAKARDALSQLHLGAYQLSQDLHKPNGLVVALRELKTHLEGLPGGLHGVDANKILGDILPGGRGRVLLVLMDQLDRLQGKMRQIAATHAAFGDAIARTQETAAFRIHASWAKIQADAVEIGDRVLPMVLGRISGIADDVDKVVQAFTGLPKGAQDLILTGGLVLAGIGPAMKLLGLFTGGVGKLWGVAQIAGRMATTGTFRAPAAAVGTAGRMSTTVATMEVGTLIAKGMIGGSGPVAGGWKLAGTSTAAAEGASGISVAEGAAGGATVSGVARGLLGAGARVLGVAGLAALAAPLAIPLVDELMKVLRGKSYGQQLADTLTSGFAPRARDDISKALDAAHKLQQRTQPSATAVPALRGRFGLGPGPTRGPGLDAAQTARIVAEQQKAGRDIAAGLAKGWNQYKFQSTPIMLTQLRSEIRSMPPQTQAAAIQSTIAFARGLEKQGRLPRGAWHRMLQDINKEFPGWQHQLGAWASMSAETFTRQLDFTRAERNTKAALAKMRGDFPQVTKAMDSTTGDVIDKSAAVVKALLHIQRDGSAPARRLASADLKTLRENVKTDLTTMASVSEQRARDMAASIKHHSVEAAVAAETNFARVARAVNRAMASGLTSARQGSQLIGDALNATLKAFGEKPINLVGLTRGQLQAFSPQQYLGGAGTTGVHQGGLASGGLMQIGRPGEQAHDSVPLNVGGTSIVVAPGEQVAVFNRHQLPVVNRALVREGIGGLPDLFRRVSRPNYMASGGIVPKRYATGGALSYGQLEGLWEQGGGPGSVAPTAAAIALAESAGQDVMQQGQPFATTGWGYWQITPGGPQFLNPLTNARAAVAKWLAAGKRFTPWTTFNDGAYRNFLHGGVPAMGGLPAALHAPGVKGAGALADIVRGALGLEAKGANAFLSRLTAPGAGMGVGPSGGGFSPSQLGIFDGLEVAKWIMPELAWARARGWTGRVTSGYRSPSEVVHGAFATAPQGQSEHRLDIYPGGAVDVSDYQQFAQIIRGYPGARKLIQLGIDPLHFSGTGHARGGLFAPGGMAHAASTHGVPSKRKKAPKSKAKLPKQLQPLPGVPAVVNKGLTKLSGLLSDHGKVAVLQDKYQATDSLFQAEHPDLTYVVTPSDGSPPYIDQNAVNLSLGELEQLYLWESQIKGYYQQAMKLVRPLMKRLQHEIEKRRKRIAAIKKRLADNLLKIKALSDQVARIKRAGTLDSRQSLPYPSARTAAQRAANATFTTQRRRRGWARDDAVSAINTTIRDLKTENQTLGGDRDKIGTGGTLGSLNRELTALNNRLGTVGQYSDDTVGVSGTGGNLNDATVTITELSQQIGQLTPGALQTQLASAASSTSTSADTSQLTSLLEQQNTTLAQELAVSQAQYKVLSGLPPFGGSFAAGGMVPGGLGEARTIIAHGGERITPAGGDGSGDVDWHLHIAGKDAWLAKLIDVRVEQRMRQTARGARRALPGRGGGV